MSITLPLCLQMTDTGFAGLMDENDDIDDDEMEDDEDDGYGVDCDG